MGSIHSPRGDHYMLWFAHQSISVHCCKDILHIRVLSSIWCCRVLSSCLQCNVSVESIMAYVVLFEVWVLDHNVISIV